MHVKQTCKSHKFRKMNSLDFISLFFWIGLRIFVKSSSSTAARDFLIYCQYIRWHFAHQEMWRSKKPTSIYFKPEGVWLTWKRMRKVYENISLKWLKTIQTSLVLPWANRKWIKENQAKRAKMRDKAKNCFTVRLKRECFSVEIRKFCLEWKLKQFEKLFCKIKIP